MKFETKYRRWYLCFSISITLACFILTILFGILYIFDSDDSYHFIILCGITLLFTVAGIIGEFYDMNKLTLDNKGIQFQHLIFKEKPTLDYNKIIGYKSSRSKHWNRIVLITKNQEEVWIRESFYKNYFDLILELERRGINKIHE